MKSGVIALTLLLAALQPALTSAPVRKTIIGCVSDGVFTSEGTPALGSADQSVALAKQAAAHQR
jgi:hypothetical protein